MKVSEEVGVARPRLTGKTAPRSGVRVDEEPPSGFGEVEVAVAPERATLVGEVLNLATLGWRAKDIAAHLGVPPEKVHSVKTLLRRQGRLAVVTRQEALVRLGGKALENTEAFLDEKDKGVTVAAMRGLGLFAGEAHGEKGAGPVVVQVVFATPAEGAREVVEGRVVGVGRGTAMQISAGECGSISEPLNGDADE